jgi:hypothetical protein
MLDGGDWLPVPTETQGGGEVSGRDDNGAVGACVAYAPRKFTVVPYDVAAARHPERFIRDLKLVKTAAKAVAPAHEHDTRIDLTLPKSSGYLRRERLRSAKITTPKYKGDSHAR